MTSSSAGRSGDLVVGRQEWGHFVYQCASMVWASMVLLQTSAASKKHPASRALNWHGRKPAAAHTVTQNLYKAGQSWPTAASLFPKKKIRGLCATAVQLIMPIQQHRQLPLPHLQQVPLRQRLPQPVKR